MSRPVPCYRVCVWDRARGRWRPYVTRTRNPLSVRLDLMFRDGLHPDEILTERRPGKGVPMPSPDAPGPARGVRLFAP